jgi:hypothetical protein
MAKMLLRPSDEAEPASAKHDQDDCVAELEQISLTEEHRNSHTGERDERSVDEANQSKNGPLMHRADSPGRAEPDSDRAYHMLRVCLSDQR